LRGSAHHLALLIREHTLEAVGIDDPLALLGRHWTQIVNGRGDRALAVGWKLLDLIENLPRLLFLFGREMFPGFHPVQHAQLLLRRKTGEVIQALLQLLLLCRRQLPKSGIVMQGFLLFRGRKIFVPAQPVAGVAGLLRMRLLRRMRLLGMWL
jgi:hypothetical protein